jgi:hypothetical protein
LIDQIASGNMYQFGIVEPEQGLERIFPSLFQKGKKKLVIDIGLPFFQFTNGFTFSLPIRKVFYFHDWPIHPTILSPSALFYIYI